MGELTGIELLYITCATLGGVLFVVRLILMFIGGDSDGDGADGIDVGEAGDLSHAADIDVNVDHATGSDASFRLLSLQGLTGFFMMFGLIGLAVFRAFDSETTGSILSILAGTAAGCTAVWVISRLFALMSGMQSSGTIDIQNALGQEGTVYLRIPADGQGKVQIAIQGRLQEMDAVSEKKEALKTGERIRTVRIVAETLLSVEKV